MGRRAQRIRSRRQLSERVVRVAPDGAVRERHRHQVGFGVVVQLRGPAAAVNDGRHQATGVALVARERARRVADQLDVAAAVAGDLRHAAFRVDHLDDEAAGGPLVGRLASERVGDRQHVAPPIALVDGDALERVRLRHHPPVVTERRFADRPADVGHVEQPVLVAPVALQSRRVVHVPKPVRQVLDADVVHALDRRLSVGQVRRQDGGQARIALAGVGAPALEAASFAVVPEGEDEARLVAVLDQQMPTPVVVRVAVLKAVGVGRSDQLTLVVVAVLREGHPLPSRGGVAYAQGCDAAFGRLVHPHRPTCAVGDERKRSILVVQVDTVSVPVVDVRQPVPFVVRVAVPLARRFFGHFAPDAFVRVEDVAVFFSPEGPAPFALGFLAHFEEGEFFPGARVGEDDDGEAAFFYFPGEGVDPAVAEAGVAGADEARVLALEDQRQGAGEGQVLLGEGVHAARRHIDGAALGAAGLVRVGVGASGAGASAAASGAVGASSRAAAASAAAAPGAPASATAARAAAALDDVARRHSRRRRGIGGGGRPCHREAGCDGSRGDAITMVRGSGGATSPRATPLDVISTCCRGHARGTPAGSGFSATATTRGRRRPRERYTRHHSGAPAPRYTPPRIEARLKTR